MDKALTKRLLATYKILTPKYRVISREHGHWNGAFALPAIVKPNAEGSSKGISDVAIATDAEQLKILVERSIALYRQDMLVEEYVGGREFTVGVLGNGEDTRVFPPMEIVYLDKNADYHIYSYNVKQNYKALIHYDCPRRHQRANGGGNDTRRPQNLRCALLQGFCPYGFPAVRGRKAVFY